MPELVTMGETMAVFVPDSAGPLRYAPGFRLRMAGAESNVAVGLCKLGHSAGWISGLGKDELGQYVLNSIRAEGVDTSCVKWDGAHPTGLMIKQLSAGETSVFYYRKGSAASHYGPEDLPLDYLADAKIIHLSGITPALSESCLAAVERMAEFANEKDILLSFDPNIRKKLWVSRDFVPLMKKLLFSCQIALLGLDEAEMILGIREPEEIVRILTENGVQYIAIKDGGNGAWCAQNGQLLHIPPEPCRCIDPIGAGDGFNAGFLAGILEGRDLAQCGKMGAVAGAMATETLGDIDGYPSKEQMEAKLNHGGIVYR